FCCGIVGVGHLDDTAESIILGQRVGPSIPTIRTAEGGRVDFLRREVIFLFAPECVVDDVRDRLKTPIAHRRARLKGAREAVIELEDGLRATRATAISALPSLNLERGWPVEIVVLNGWTGRVVARTNDFREATKGIIEILRRGRLAVRIPRPPHLAERPAI